VERLHITPLADHPELHVDFHCTNDLKGPLVPEKVDLVVDCRRHVHPALHRTELFREKYVVVGSPEFLTHHPVRTPRDRRDVVVLSLDRDRQWWAYLLSAPPAAQRFTPERSVVVDHIRGMINATLSDYGISLLPKHALLAELRRGALTVLFPRLRLLEDTFCIYQKVTRLARPGLATEGRRRLNALEREGSSALCGQVGESS
jgi:DNA-binding transcriptional LysR family regulator